MLLIGFFAVRIAAADSAPDTCEIRLSLRARAVLPLARIGMLQVGMHVAATALWPSGYNPLAVEKNRRQLARSWTRRPDYDAGAKLFESDGDWWYFNVFAHGLFGSEGYLAGRDLGHGPMVSFLYALLASTTWEYLVEGFYKQPSAIDLFWTPACGVLLGELRYRLHRWVSTRISARPLRTILRVALNPFGTFQDLLMGCER